MNKALAFVRLDFITIKPYITVKNLFIFSAVALFMLVSSGAIAVAIAMLVFYATMFVSYPFAVGEQNGIDALYTTLSIKRGTVVLGRYLFALILDVCAGLLAYLFSFAALTVTQKNFDAIEALVVTLVTLLLYSIIQAVQLPIYFKLGYAKAKLLAYLPFMVLALVGVLFSNFLKDSISLQQITDFFGWFETNPLASVLLGGAAWLGIMVISYQSALSYYRKRDF